jgi:hypothetical protein
MVVVAVDDWSEDDNNVDVDFLFGTKEKCDFGVSLVVVVAAACEIRMDPNRNLWMNGLPYL